MEKQASYENKSGMKVKTWPTVIAHRGVSGYYPENTLLAFSKVSEFNTRWFECDVTLTKDFEPVIFHDKSLWRLAKKKRLVQNCSWSYLQNQETLQAQRIPHLSQVLELALASGLAINLELKPNGFQPLLLAQIVGDFLMAHPKLQAVPLLISSFDFECLAYFQQHYPNFSCALVTVQPRRSLIIKAKEMNCVSFHCSYEKVTAPIVETIHAAGLKCFVYTVNTFELAQHLYNQGVDGVFTDYPNLIEKSTHGHL